MIDKIKFESSLSKKILNFVLKKAIMSAFDIMSIADVREFEVVSEENGVTTIALNGRLKFKTNDIQGLINSIIFNRKENSNENSDV